MSDRDWQYEVLSELGVLEAGLVPPSPLPPLIPLNGPAASPEPPRAADPALDPLPPVPVPRASTEHPPATALASAPPSAPTPPSTVEPGSAPMTGPPPRPERLVQRNPHGDRAIRRLGRSMRKVVGASATTGERDRSELTAQLGAPVRSCRRIAVMSIRGGAGKSSIAALLAGTIQQHRDDRVLVIDADPGLGSLPLRLGVAGHTSSLQDVVAARPRSWAEASPHLARTQTGAWVLGGTSQDAYRSGAGLLSRYFSVSVIDCGTGMGTPLHQSVLSSAHALVFVVPGTQDGAVSAQAALRWLQENGHDPVVAVVAHTPDVERTRDLLATDTVIVPFDRHLSTGTTINPDRVGAATHTAIARIAAESFGRAQREGTP
ncbi:hypothetical protein ACQP1W_48565 [Spirillospora sp. CA-255316]